MGGGSSKEWAMAFFHMDLSSPFSHLTHLAGEHEEPDFLDLPLTMSLAQGVCLLAFQQTESVLCDLGKGSEYAQKKKIFAIFFIKRKKDFK